MLAMEEVLCELSDHEKRNEQGLPPGFRFHPTDEELITFYLASKVFNGCFTTVKFAEVDLNRCEPWELPGIYSSAQTLTRRVCMFSFINQDDVMYVLNIDVRKGGCNEADVAKMGEREWYLFSLRDRKYPTGLRTNRATGAGYWKATGKDKEVFSASSGTLLGMKKTLVFYKGRAPRGEKTKWVMHEYRLDGDFSLPHPHPHHISKEEWVICRIFHKSAEKRTALLQNQGQGHSDASSSPTKSSLPPLLPSPTSFPLELEDQNHLSHSHPYLFPLHASPQLTNTRNHPSFSDLFSPLSQQQNCILKAKEKTAPKVIKTEEATALYQYHLLGDTDNLRLNQNLSNFPNPFADVEVDGAGLMAFAGGPNGEVRDMSPSTAFKRVGLQQLIDAAHIGIDSWPLAQHV
ncbi:hypothetical protein V8G54_007756 [Vigna mungo]|uniref:NAC domain-containing protein n=1 Tax=Vigna mungo TaxID=3915 RepID=A0AAQ3S9D7_VIGMU